MSNPLYISMYQHWHETSEIDPEDEWSRASTDCDNTLTGIFVNEADTARTYDSITPCFEHEIGQTVYLVWAEYSDGDSFGNDSGKVEIVDIFSNEELANACARAVRVSEDGGNQDFSFARQNGQTIKQSCPWFDYFAHLDTVHVDSLVIQ
jgi:hypothetical protein